MVLNGLEAETETDRIEEAQNALARSAWSGLVPSAYAVGSRGLPT